MSDPDVASVIETPFDAALSERYLVYALSTITARSLPDVRDGPKPVHRRLLWAMRLLRLDPGGAYKKSARVVGDVIGKYHPHGDQSVYDAMVRLAQDFALRYPLVDGQGNFGNIDGDNAAAYRYTEARLTAVAMQLMAGLDEGTVDYKPTYNGEEEEPEVFPGLFPNLLANGASGIAVGMATSIPPHNVGELIDAAVRLIDDPKLDDQVRLILEPRARTVDANLLLESLYRLTDLEIRFPLNLNVLDATRTPGVMSLKEALLAWLDFQREVLENRLRTRIGKIDDRL